VQYCILKNYRYAQNQKIGKPNNLKVLEAGKPKRLKD
jgi:hypothetical protein